MTRENEPRHCVVWFGEPTAEERASLDKAGWHTRVASALKNDGVGTRRDDIVVGVADIRHGDALSRQAMANMMDTHPWLPWLAVILQETAASSPDVEHILRASADFFTTPVDVPELLKTLTKIGDGCSVESGDEGVVGIVGVISPAMRAAMASLRKFAPVELPVLITGETGSGKEVAARALHGLSSRREGPFIAINCGAMPVNLVQSELFGHERGAFTGANVRRIGHFEAAAGGTVFLDEIGDLPLDAQTSLLRFLQEGTLERVGSSQPLKIDVRVVAATHVNLERAISDGRFREDLYYRLNVLRLAMPPLRQREGDVELLAQHFLDAFRLRHHGRARAFSLDARQAMRQHAWPGNVRELLNRVHRAAVVAEGSMISAADLDLGERRPSVAASPSLDLSREAAEQKALLKSLRECRFNISECARRLNVSRVTVYRLCKKHGLDVARLRSGKQPAHDARPVKTVNEQADGGSPASQNM
ncbi:MAG TPA: sigma-54 dependent transcriptional regulator [Rhodanobacter sp.]